MSTPNERPAADPASGTVSPAVPEPTPTPSLATCPTCKTQFKEGIFPHVDPATNKRCLWDVPPTPSESATPRCDAFEIVGGVRYSLQPREGIPHWPTLARQLERELDNLARNTQAALQREVNENAELSRQKLEIGRELSTCRARIAALDRQVLMDTECIERITTHGLTVEAERDALRTKLATAEAD